MGSIVVGSRNHQKHQSWIGSWQQLFEPIGSVALHSKKLMGVTPCSVIKSDDIFFLKFGPHKRKAYYYYDDHYFSNKSMNCIFIYNCDFECSNKTSFIKQETQKNFKNTQKPH